MPWKETCVMNQRIQFISDWLSEDYTVTDLCHYYEISRPTAYKWIRRYEEEGLDGLKEQSRRPHHHPQAVPDELKQQIIQAKLAHQSWGPKKVLDYLYRQQAKVTWPVDSTAGEILKRAGLVKPRGRRRRVGADPQPFQECDRANRVWSADFKGEFRLGHGRWCYPLTVTDNFSRYLLACRGLSGTACVGVHPWFEWVFREYGLPEAIRTDNGPPFASLALGGISQLSKWWIQLGIKPERIKPGKPSQNGRHERMHRSLKEATALPPGKTMAAQQRRFDIFVKEYNEDRSHEALQRQTPAQLYVPAQRSYPVKIKPVEYDEGMVVRQVRHNGEIKWRGQMLYISQVLAGDAIALVPQDDGQWQISYSFYPLGILDEKLKKIICYKQWHGTTHRKSVNHVPGLFCKL